MAAIPLLLGHRGARSTTSVPENTLASFDLALQHGCDGFELDVRRTSDARALVCHDPKVNHLKVCNSTSNQLPQCPLLEDVLRLYAGRAFLDIELKVPGLETSVLAALREDRPQRDYVVSSFLPEVIMEIKVRSAGVPAGIICQNQKQLARWHELPVEYVIAKHQFITLQMVRDVHATNRKLFAWTVNDPEIMLRLADWDIDGIISDQTELMVRTFAVKSRTMP